MATATITFSARVYKSTAQQLNREILKSATGSPEMRKEMNRVFQQANRRIQNITKSGVVSPAVEGLKKAGRNVKGGGEFSTVFTIAGTDLSNPQAWERAKNEYGEAMAFLNQTTSTATGAKEYNRALAAQHGLTEEQMETVQKAIYSNETLSNEVMANGEKYRAYVDDVVSGITDAANEISADADAFAEQLQAQIEAQAAKVTNQTMDLLNGFAQGFGGGSPRLH